MVIFQESKLGNEITDQSFDYLNFNMIRRDWVDGGGGLLVFIKKCYEVIFNLYIDNNFETICLTLTLKEFQINFIISYNPHFEYQSSHHSHLELMLKKFNPTSRICIIEDLNQDLNTSRGNHLLS